MQINFDEWPDEFYSYGELLSETDEKLTIQASHPIEGEKTIYFSPQNVWSDCGFFKLERAFHP